MKKVVLAFLAITLLFACKKDEVTDYNYRITIESPTTDAKKVGDVMPIKVVFDSQNKEEIGNINVKIYNKDSKKEIYNGPSTAAVNATEGTYTLSDELTLSLDNGVTGYSNWILEATVWATNATTSKVTETVEFHVHPMHHGSEFAMGVFILNEGGFGKGNASLSFLKNGSLTNDVFKSKTELDLGDTAQSIGFNGDKAFIVVNGSNKIEVVNRYTLAHIKTITGALQNPRYVAFSDNKAYVTNWGDASNPDDDFLAVINLDDYSMSKVTVTEGPEQIINYNDKFYVAHKGGWSTGNTVSVFNPANSKVEKTITVGDYPNSIVEEEGYVYVLCQGKQAWGKGDVPTKGGLYKINTSDNSIAKTSQFAEGVHPGRLVEGNDKLYYTIGSDIYTTDYTINIPASATFTSGATSLYGLAFNNDKLYVGDGKDYASNGEVFIYSLDGTLDKSYTTGVLPNGFYFNN